MKSMPGIDLSQPKLPPQNVEAEPSVLGAILLDNQAMAKAMELVVEENFYRTAHRKIYRAMLELSETGEVIDHITLFFFQAEDGIRDGTVTGVQTCALPI